MVDDSSDNSASRQLPSGDEVAAYLEAHPDFFLKHPELVHGLAPPNEHRDSRATGIVDFQHFMVRRLQGDIARQSEERQELIHNARINLNLLTRIHSSVLALLEAQSFEQMIAAITGDLAVYLDVDVAALIIEMPPANHNGADIMGLPRGDVRIVGNGRVGEWMGRKDVLLQGDIQGNPEIYGEAAGLVRSEALLRLEVSRHAPLGMLAFGSRAPDLFQDGQGTELVGFLARVVERCIRAWLDLPE